MPDWVKQTLLLGPNDTESHAGDLSHQSSVGLPNLNEELLNFVLRFIEFGSDTLTFYSNLFCPHKFVLALNMKNKTETC